MKISLKVEYACRVLAQLSKTYQQKELPHIEQLANAEEIPANYLVQILNDLRGSGLIISRRGKQGGYALSREPDKITVRDIIRAIDGEVLEFTSAEKGESGAKVSGVWTDIVKNFEEKANSITVLDMTATPEQEMYFI